jgi:hypothetical protein
VLWDRLLVLNGEGLARAIVELTDRELRIVLFGAGPRISEPRALNTFAEIMRLRSPSVPPRLAVYAYIVSDGDRRLSESAAKAAAREAVVLLWIDIVHRPDPVARCCELFLEQRYVFDEWVANSDVQLNRSRAVSSAIRRRLLEPARVLSLLKHEGTDTLVGWLAEVYSEGEQEHWFAGYLALTDARAWDPRDPVLNEVLKRFLPPERERDFWKRVAPERIKLFQQWMRNRELTQFFGEGDRVNFWRLFLPWIEACPASRSRNAVFVRFENWFAVQFVATGHATHLFKLSQWNQLRSLDGNALATRVRELAHRKDVWIDSYEHRGYWWADKAEAIVRCLINSVE